MTLTALATLFIAAAAAQAPAPEPQPPREIEAVLSHPLYTGPYVCSEHAAGELPYPGDDLGQDCMIGAFDDTKTPNFIRLYKTDGATNADWYGFKQPVHSPCTCKVAGTMLNPKENTPGNPDKSRASGVLLQREDGTMFVVAHLGSIGVKQGDELKAGDVIGTVGNNGYARAPHIHIGAWRGKQALQIRWDQNAMKVQ